MHFSLRGMVFLDMAAYATNADAELDRDHLISGSPRTPGYPPDLGATEVNSIVSARLILTRPRKWTFISVRSATQKPRGIKVSVSQEGPVLSRVEYV